MGAKRKTKKLAAQAPPEPVKRAKKRKGRKLTLLMFAAVLALALSSDLRDKVLDTLFGAEEEFDYTSSTAPVVPTPAAPTA